MATVDDSTFTDNMAIGDRAFGGAISNPGFGPFGPSILEITDSKIEKNQANGVSSALGGGIQNSGGFACVDNTKVVDNFANGVEDNIFGAVVDSCP